MLHSFGPAPDGSIPFGLHLDPSTGILSGTTEYGGTSNEGTVFQLTNNGGSWVETQLHSFGNHGDDGIHPYARPTEDTTTAYLYGTTSQGGAYSGGTAYLIVP